MFRDTSRGAIFRQPITFCCILSPLSPPCLRRSVVLGGLLPEVTRALPTPAEPRTIPILPTAVLVLVAVRKVNPHAAAAATAATAGTFMTAPPAPAPAPPHPPRHPKCTRRRFFGAPDDEEAELPRFFSTRLNALPQGGQAGRLPGDDFEANRGAGLPGCSRMPMRPSTPSPALREAAVRRGGRETTRPREARDAAATSWWISARSVRRFEWRRFF